MPLTDLEMMLAAFPPQSHYGAGPAVQAGPGIPFMQPQTAQMLSQSSAQPLPGTQLSAQSEADCQPAQSLNGFLYNPRLLYAPNRYLPLALEGVRPYDDHNYSPRLFAAPVNPLITIGAGLTVDTQLRIVPGSVIIGLRFCTFAIGGGAVPSPSLMQYLIRDSDTQKSFTDGESRFLNCNQLVPTTASGAAFCLFAKPYLVSGSGEDDGGGVITVSLTNITTATAINCQLLVYVLEPAQIETEACYGSIMVPRAGTQRSAGNGQHGHNRHDHVRLRRPKGCPV